MRWLIALAAAVTTGEFLRALFSTVSRDSTGMLLSAVSYCAEGCVLVFVAGISKGWLVGGLYVVAKIVAVDFVLVAISIPLARSESNPFLWAATYFFRNLGASGISEHILVVLAGMLGGHLGSLFAGMAGRRFRKWSIRSHDARPSRE